MVPLNYRNCICICISTNYDLLLWIMIYCSNLFKMAFAHPERIGVFLSFHFLISFDCNRFNSIVHFFFELRELNRICQIDNFFKCKLKCCSVSSFPTHLYPLVHFCEFKYHHCFWLLISFYFYFEGGFLSISK